ncbi:hypothetical protein ACWFRF_15495 [Nocardia sp. NPDC055165]
MYVLKTNLKHDGITYVVGDSIDAEVVGEEVVAQLLAEGSLVEPTQAKEQSNEVAAAKDQAAQIVAGAKTKAKAIVEDAKKEAEQIKAEALKEAEPGKPDEEVSEPATEEAEPTVEKAKVGDDEYTKTTYASGIVRYARNGETIKKADFESAVNDNKEGQS